MTLNEARAAFLANRPTVPALPIAGCIGWSTAAMLSVVVPAGWHNWVLTTCFWASFPLAAAIGRLRNERVVADPTNPLAQLLNFARGMVLATWAIHVPVWIVAPDLYPLTLGIAFGLHWVIFSWAVGHPIGIIHLAVRIPLVLAAWWLVPGDRMGAVAAAVAFSYALSAVQMTRIDWRALAGRHAFLT